MSAQKVARQRKQEERKQKHFCCVIPRKSLRPLTSISREKKSRISLPIPCPPSWKSICLPFIFFYTWFIFFFLGKHVFRVHLIESPAFPVSFFIKKTTPDIAPQWVSWKKRSHGSIGPDFFVEFCAHFLCENESIVTKWNYHGNGATRLFRNWSPRPCNALSRFRPIKIFPSYTPNFKRRYTHRDLALFLTPNFTAEKDEWGAVGRDKNLHLIFRESGASFRLLNFANLFFSILPPPFPNKKSAQPPQQEYKFEKRVSFSPPGNVHSKSGNLAVAARYHLNLSFLGGNRELGRTKMHKKKNKLDSAGNQSQDFSG